MTCSYCQLTNSDEEHRCARCGRRLQGGDRQRERVAVRSIGATALAGERVMITAAAPRPAERKRATEISMDAAQTLDALPRRPAQSSLFGAELQPKIIPFETLSKAEQPLVSAAPQRVVAMEAEPKTEKPRRATKPAARRSSAEDNQATLDFLPPTKTAQRTLKTQVDAVIYCDAIPAAPAHRATAAVLDIAMMLIAFGIILTAFQFGGQPGVLGRFGFLALGGMFGCTALFYGLLFAIAGTVTPGAAWTHLRLINFDGFAPDWKSRLLRVAGCWISVLSAGLGIFWSLVDEEGLTWHDHISNSFPTLRESESIVVRHQAR